MRKHTGKEEHFQTVQRVVTQVMLFVIHVENLWDRDRIWNRVNIQLRLWMPEKQIVISKEKQVKKNVQYVIKY